MERRTETRHSESFKLQVVRELEEARHGSCRAAMEAYGIHEAETVYRWARQYGRLDENT